MGKERSLGVSRKVMVVAAMLANGAFGCSAVALDNDGENLGQEQEPLLEEFIDSLPNNFPIPNALGAAASYSTTTAPIRNGVFADLNKFKTPNIRGLASRAPYFHNGIAADIPAIIDHYEAALGFDFTDQEETDLVAFLAAL